MTAVDLLRAARRRWYVTLLGLVFTAAVVAMVPPKTIYYSSQIVSLESPPTPAVPKIIGRPDSDPVPVAEILADLVTEDNDAMRSRSPDATLYGEGITDASSARVANIGNQWVTWVPLPNIQVESVGSTPAETVELQTREIDKISARLEALQDQFNVAEQLRLTLTITPQAPSVQAIHGSRARAFGPLVLVGLFLTLWLVYVVDRVATRRAVRSALGWHRTRSQRLDKLAIRRIPSTDP